MELSATIVAEHPALLILSGALLGIFLLVTIPFLSVLIRLFLLGHIGTPGESSTDKVWQTDAKARILAWTTLGAWLWTWSTLRGIQRVTVAGVVSHWYFFRDKDDTGDKSQAYDSTLNDSAASSIPGPAPGNWLGDEEAQRGPSQVEVVRASFNRAVGSALGTVCASALILTLARLAALVASSARKISRQLSMPGRPSWMQPIAHVAAILAGISALLQGLSDYALIYVGITGESFLAASRRSTRLITRHTVKGIMDGESLFLCFPLALSNEIAQCLAHLVCRPRNQLDSRLDHVGPVFLDRGCRIPLFSSQSARSRRCTFGWALVRARPLLDA